MSLEKPNEKQNFIMDLHNIPKSEIPNNKSSKDNKSKTYEPTNLLIKNYLATSGVKLKPHSDLVKEKMSQYRKVNGYKKKLVSIFSNKKHFFL